MRDRLLREARSLEPSCASLADLQHGRYLPVMVPLLARWLRTTRDPDVRLLLIMSLAHAHAKAAARTLASEFRREAGHQRWSIGNALFETATDDVASELVRLATQRAFGRARQMVVMALGKLTPTPAVIAAAVSQLDDRDVLPHAIDAVGRLGVRAARARLVKLTDDPSAPIRRYAKKALERIDRSVAKRAAVETKRAPKSAARTPTRTKREPSQTGSAKKPARRAAPKRKRPMPR